MHRRVGRGAAVAAALVGALVVAVRAQPQADIDIDSLRGMAWRSIGPFRGGRTTAVVGTAAQPHTFLAGTANGGVWKTTDAGRTWRPIFDAQATGSIGAIAIAPSNPAIVYVGTGEMPIGSDASAGNGVYRSSDGGVTWTHLGLSASPHIPAIVVDLRNPDRLLVAAAGRAFGPSAERGVFRSTDGGRSFQRVLFVDDDTGALDVAFDPADSSIVYATLRQSRQGPVEGPATGGPATGLHKSTDGGTTWRPIGSGLPTFAADRLDRISMAVAPGNARRLFAVAHAQSRGGLYRSDDAGESWAVVNAGTDLIAAEAGSVSVAVDGTNADVVYVTGASVRKSTDGGKTFSMWRPALDGAGYQRVWLSNTNGAFAALAGGRGAIVTVNGGATWSSADNQPTGQFARAVTDTAFPYRVCAAERNSAPRCFASRGDDGSITGADWRAGGIAAGAFVAPDPTDPDVLYSGAIDRFDRRTMQAQDIRPPYTPGDRIGRDAPVLFAPNDPRSLYFATSRLWKTTNGGQIWSAVSPDLARAADETSAGSSAAPASRVAHQGAISVVAPSPLDTRIIWAGTDDGLVHVTRDAGATWRNVTPPGLVAGSAVSAAEASHFDVNTAYIAVNRTRLNDPAPHLWRTRDGGATWIEIVATLPPDGAVNAVVEDGFRRGLLFAAAGQSVYVSFDDGERWRSLRLNLPATSVRGLVIKEADLVAATWGRGLWILDDVSVLRQITADVARASLFLFRPATAWRLRSSERSGSGSGSDEPSAPNPPEGVAISYLAGAGLTGAVTLEIIETLTGEVIRRFSSTTQENTGDTGPLPITPGLHRVIWDLRYAPVDGRSVWALPGTYQVRLSAGERVLRQAIVVRMDPRVRAGAPDLAAQLKLSRAVQDKRREIAGARAGSRPGAATASPRDAALADAALALDDVLGALQQSDTRPTAATEAAAAGAIERANAALGQGGTRQ